MIDSKIDDTKTASPPSSQFGITNYLSAIAFLDPVAGIERNVKVRVSGFGSASAGTALVQDNMYFLSGRMVLPDKKGTPTIYYDNELNFLLGESDLVTQSIANKTSVWGFGNVLSKHEVNELGNNYKTLLVVLRHTDYDNDRKGPVNFDIHYRIPGNKNLGKAFAIFQIGREIIIAGHITDYDKKAKVWMITALNAATASGDHTWANEETDLSSQSSKPRRRPNFLDLDSEEEDEIELTTPPGSDKGKGKSADSSGCSTLIGSASGSGTVNRIGSAEGGEVHTQHMDSFSTKRGGQHDPTTSAMAFQGVVVRSPQENNEAFLIENFGRDIPNNVGKCEDACDSCGALHWRAERTVDNRNALSASYSSCCQKGKIEILVDYNSDNYPDFLKRWMTGTDDVSAHFQRFIRSYNNALSFVSMGAQLDHDTSPASFAQIYVVGGNDVEEAMLRQVQSRSDINHDMLLVIQNWLTDNNSYARWYRSVQQHLESNPTSQFYLRSLHDQRFGPRVYNRPRVEEVGMVIDRPEEDTIAPRDILLHRHSGALERITDEFPGYLPLRFPVFFPFGEQGWIMNWHRGAEDLRRFVTRCEWYAAMIFDHRGRFSPILHGKTLFQELLVDLYICVERNRLDYLRFHQREIKADLYRGLAESLRGDRDPEGRRIILPSSFIGSPRSMVQLFQDAMAIVRVFGRPSLFITITANPRWPEILSELEPNQVTSDRPDLVTRVFQLKLKSILGDLTEQHCLGLVVAFVYTIEFQKRGLPHAHLMLIMDPAHVPRTVAAVDSLICAELPDPILEPTLFGIVTGCMLHGPCDESKPCWRNGSCKDRFPRAFNPVTSFVENAYPNYRRRLDGRQFIKNGHTFTNQHVVPHNKFLTLKYNCHINVEISVGIGAVKYLFKYITKGMDRSAMNLRDQDETRRFVNGRYVGPSEAAHRLFQFAMSERYPSVTRLSLHLDDQQTVFYVDEEGLRRQFESGRANRTNLTEYFELNRANAVGLGMPARELLYQDIPRFFWFTKDKRWRRRQRESDAVGRIYYASINEGERYFLRLLLLNRRGAISFVDLRTVDDHVHPTYRAAAEALGLLISDRHYERSISEASSWMLGDGLRNMFCIILVHCGPSNPQRLLNMFINDLSDDCQAQILRLFPNLEPSVENVHALGLFHINECLKKHNKSFADVGLYDPDQHLWATFALELIPERVSVEQSQINYTNNYDTLTPTQSSIVDHITHLDLDNVDYNLFIDGPGGCGKTYVFNTLIHYFNSQEIPVATVASSGVASLMLIDGTTAHARFRIPLHTDSTTVCTWERRSQLVRFLRTIRVIIWDEISMQHRYTVETVDRSFRDLRDNDQPFGGILVIFGGDFRQTLPVVRGGTIYDQGSVCMINSPIWNTIRSMKLTENLRLRSDPSQGEDNRNRLFSEWLLNLGDGLLQREVAEMVQLPFGEVVVDPQEVVVAGSCIRFVYLNLRMHTLNLNSSDLGDYFNSRIILTPLNINVKSINERCLAQLPGTGFTSRSVDTMENDDADAIPEEVLHTLLIPNFPDHTIQIKRNMPVILLRSLNLAHGLSNGTRLLVTDINSCALKCRIISGSRIGDIISLCKVRIIHHADEQFGVTFYRLQFPVAAAFAMTVNKSQGQSLSMVSVFLPQPVFALYVALSRVTCVDKLFIGLVGQSDGLPSTENVAHLDILRRSNQSAEIL
ncbi:hypothetical protein MJO29_013133 [Puccinia striiformis f. sp. tritici]|nr:hypothetical protein MJO29_013133 [Puccinia striiformis f. sp. tritici]